MYRLHIYVSQNDLKLNVSQFMRYLKDKISLIIFGNRANLKYKYGQKTFLAGGYVNNTIRMYEKKKIKIYNIIHK